MKSSEKCSAWLRQRLSYSEVAQNDVAFEVVCPEVEFLQRRVAVVDPGAVFFFKTIFSLNIQLVLFRIILKVEVFQLFSNQILIQLTTPLLNLMAVIKSGSLAILLLATEMLFRFRSNFKVFGKFDNKLSSIRNSSNLRTGKSSTEAKTIENSSGEAGAKGGEDDAWLKVKIFINYPCLLVLFEGKPTNAESEIENA